MFWVSVRCGEHYGVATFSRRKQAQEFFHVMRALAEKSILIDNRIAVKWWSNTRRIAYWSNYLGDIDDNVL